MLVKTFQLVEATHVLLDEVNDIYLKCRESLLENGIFQWDEQYPNKEYFKECINYKVLFVLMKNTEIVGHVVLNEWESEEWAVIPWEGSKPLIIHSLMIDPSMQGKGLARDFIKLCEDSGRENGYESIRLDAFSGNEKVIHLYKNLGYEQKGSVFFSSKPEGHQEYFCFEKKL